MSKPYNVFMKNIGIIGGLGPETTSKFYLELLYKSFQLNDSQRPSVLMWSIPMDYQIEKDFILGEDRSSEYIKYLVEAAQRLEVGGADFIVVPCNSVHIFINQIIEAVSIPVLNIVEETSRFLTKNKINTVGLLATQASINDELYQNELRKNNIDIVLPSGDEQKKMGVLINKLVRNEYSEDQKQELTEVINGLVNDNVDAVLLACTDLQLLTPKHNSIKIIDTMKILVDSTVKMSLGL
jgi:aspartate racemase